MPFRLSAMDLNQLTARGARPAGPAPAGPALRPDRLAANAVIELERTADRYGIVGVGRTNVTIGAPVAGQRLLLRLDGHLMHVIANGYLIKTLPAPVPADERAGLREARLADTPLIPPPPTGPTHAQRRIPADGIVMVARQRLRVGWVHAGKTVTILIQDTHFHVLDGDEELSTHPRQTDKPATAPALLRCVRVDVG